MTRTLIVIDSLGCGGAEKSLLAYLGTFDPHKDDVTLMLSARGGVLEPLLPAWVRVIDCPKLTGFNAFYRRLRHTIARRLCRGTHGAEIYWNYIGSHLPSLKGEYDVAIAYHQGFPTYFVIQKVQARKKLAWVNVDLNAAGYSPDYNLIFYRLMDEVVCVSEALKKDLTSHGYPLFANAKVVYDIINPEVIRKLSKAFAITAPNGKCVLTTVGRMAKQKNYLLAVETARCLRDKDVDFLWYFVGDGPERAAVEAKIREYGLGDCIELVGLQINPYPWMAACDVYVQTSSFEGFGLTIAEAKILGKPIVSTNFTVVTDQLTDGDNCLITPMDPEALASAIHRLLDKG